MCVVVVVVFMAHTTGGTHNTRQQQQQQHQLRREREKRSKSKCRLNSDFCHFTLLIIYLDTLTSVCRCARFVRVSGTTPSFCCYYCY